MKKLFYMIAVILAGTFLTFNKAHAWFGDFTPLIPIAPQLSPIGMPTSIVVAVKYAKQAKQMADTFTQYKDVTAVKQKFAAYASKLGNSAFNFGKQKALKKKKVISYSRMIKESKVADIHREDSVKEAFEKLFLNYPSDKADMKFAYKEKGEQFKIDTTLELFITAKEMAKELYGEDGAQDATKKGLIQQIYLFEKCMEEGENCEELGLESCDSGDGGDGSSESASSGDNEEKEDNVCFWNNALKVVQIYNKLMRYNEYLTSMQAQFYAAMSIDNAARIKEYKKDKNEKTGRQYFSKINELPKADDYAYSEIAAKVMFADMTSEEAEGVQEADALENNGLEKFDNVSGFPDDLAGKEEDLATLAVLSEINKDLDEAKQAHNMKQLLPEYRKAFESQKTMREYYQKTLDYLNIAKNCAAGGMSIKQMYGPQCREFDVSQNLIACHYTPTKYVSDVSPSKYLYDVPNYYVSDEAGKLEVLPSDDSYTISLNESNFYKSNESGFGSIKRGGKEYWPQEKIYVQSADEEDFEYGFMSYLKDFSEQAKEEDAISENETYIAEDGNGVSENKGEGVYVTPLDTDDGDDFGAIDDSISNTKKNSKSDSSATADQLALDQKSADETKAEARKNDLMNWVLGSEIVKMAVNAGIKGEDVFNITYTDAKTGKRVGNFSEKPALWHDQKEFYDQYIDGKYANIRDYVGDLPVTDVLAGLSSAINAIFPYYAEDITDNENRLQRLKKRYNASEDEEERAELSDSISSVNSKIKKLYKQREDKRAENEDSIGNLGKSLSEFDTPEKKISELIYNENKKFENLLSEHKRTMKSIQNRKDELYALLDKDGRDLDALNKRYNELKEIVKNAQDEGPKSSEGLDLSKALYAFFDRVVNLNSGSNKNFSDSKNENKQKEQEALAELRKLGDPSVLEQKIKDEKKELDGLNNALEEERKNFVKRSSDAEYEARVASDNFVAEYKNSAPTGFINEAMSAIIPVQYAGRLMRCIQDYGVKQVDIAINEIKSYRESGDEQIYNSVRAKDTIHPIHKRMVDRLTNITAADLIADGCEVIAELEALSAGSAEIFVEPLAGVFKTLCKDDFCTTPDGNYFVGLLPQKRDLSMPKEAIDFASAPLREVLHFDVVDYNSIDKYYMRDNLASNDALLISRYSFLNSGLDIPEIWRYILKRHAFEEKEFDLTRLLGDKGSTGFLGSGIYPCRIVHNYKSYEVAPARKGSDKYLYVVRNTGDSSLRQCANIELQFNNRLMPDMPSAAIDLEAGGSPGTEYMGNADEWPADYEVGDSRFGKGYNANSELGTILAYVPNKEALIKLRTEAISKLRAEAISKYGYHGASMVSDKDIEIDESSVRHDLTFNYDLQKMVYIQDNTKEIGKNARDDALLYMSRRAFLSNDVFGSYFDMKDLVVTAKDSVAKVDLQIETIKDDLRSVFVGTGFDIREDFNLLNNDDYAAAERVLDNKKEEAMQKVISELDNVNGKTESIKNKFEQITHTLEVMITDADEVVHISGDEDLNELSEKIKTQNANSSVEDKYGKEGDEEFERQREQLRPPYCPVYSVF